jgi:glycerol-3-phosphate dehydrogenase
MAMRAGFLLDRLVAFDRNAGVPRALRLPAGKLVSRADAAQRFPGLRRRGLTAAAVWHDYITPESDRLTLSFALTADEHGAVLANHTEAISLRVEGKRVIGVLARDRQTGQDREIAARLTVNATGASLDRLLVPIGAATGMPLLKAMNLVTRRDAGEEALGGRTPSGRTLFLVPWRERALLGTWESAQEVGPDALDVTGDDVQAFISELNQAFPSLDLTLADVTLVHRGVVPAVRTSNGQVRLARHEQIRDHREQAIAGLISVAGTKYTTARAVAARVVDRAMASLQLPLVRCRTATALLPGGSLRDVMLGIADARRDHDADLPSDTIPHLIAAYGSRYRDVLGLAATRPQWRKHIAEDSAVIGAELVWAVRKEMAITLADAVIRRTPLGALECPADPTLESASTLVGHELGWSDDRRREEIAAVKRFYEMPGRAGPVGQVGRG